MDFSGEMAAIQQQLARSHDMNVRRTRVLETLDAAPGERVLEVGCGSGLYLRDVGVAVGPTGAAVGVDTSEDQVRVAGAHCADLRQVDVRVGDLLALGGLGQPFDATLSVQVLEYVANVAAAVAGLADLTRPGGRFVNVATNWGALFWTGGNTALTARIVATWDEHAPHPNLPVALPSLLETSGFGGVRQAPVTIINRHFDPNTFGYGAARLMAAFALTRADVSSLDVEAWFSSLEEADAEGRYFLSSVPVLTTATRLG